MRILLSVMACLVAGSHGLSGQEEPNPPAPPPVGAPRLVPGARVRVWTEGHRYTGTLTALSNDSLWLAAKPPVVVVPSAVRRVDISAGKRGHFLLGLGIGTAVGLGAGKAAADASEDELGAGVTGAMVWAAGTVVGGIVGALIKSDRWVQVTDWSPVPQTRPPPVAHGDFAGEALDSLDEAARP